MLTAQCRTVHNGRYAENDAKGVMKRLLVNWVSGDLAGALTDAHRTDCFEIRAWLWSDSPRHQGAMQRQQTARTSIEPDNFPHVTSPRTSSTAIRLTR